MFRNAGARGMYFQAHLLATMPGQTTATPPNHDGIVSLVQAQYYFEDSFSQTDKTTLQSLLSQEYSLVDDKVDKYLSEEGRPGLQFLKDVQFFILRKL